MADDVEPGPVQAHVDLSTLPERLLGGTPKYTRQQVAELTGVSEEEATKIWRSLGFAAPDDDDAVFTDGDVEALRMLDGLRATGLSDERTQLSLARLLSRSMARLAESQVDRLAALGVVAPGDRPGEPVGPAEAEPVLAVIEKLQSYVWRRHLAAASDRLRSGAPHGETTVQAVGFADVVGFTSISRGLDADQLAEFVEAFESATSAVVAEHGARVVKMIGDEIMFVADTPESAAAIGLDLADRISELDGRPDLRIGLAYGPVLRRMGDAFGSVVNIAARLTSLARPGTVLVDSELAGALTDDAAYRLTRLRRVSVRGFAHLQPWLLRRPGERHRVVRRRSRPQEPEPAS